VGKQDKPRSPGAILRASIHLNPNIAYSKDDFCEDLRRVSALAVSRSRSPSAAPAHGHLRVPDPSLLLRNADNSIDAMTTFFSKYGDSDTALDIGSLPAPCRLWMRIDPAKRRCRPL
jgi:hypothetical protein